MLLHLQTVEQTDQRSVDRSVFSVMFYILGVRLQSQLGIDLCVGPSYPFLSYLTLFINIGYACIWN